MFFHPFHPARDFVTKWLRNTVSGKLDSIKEASKTTPKTHSPPRALMSPEWVVFLGSLPVDIKFTCACSEINQCPLLLPLLSGNNANAMGPHWHCFLGRIHIINCPLILLKRHFPLTRELSRLDQATHPEEEGVIPCHWTQLFMWPLQLTALFNLRMQFPIPTSSHRTCW